MFSQKIYAEIARVTQKALDEMPSRKTIDQVTVILGYVQLSSRNVPGYDAELTTAIERLRELARADNRGELTDALEALGHEMDQERTAWLNSQREACDQQIATEIRPWGHRGRTFSRRRHGSANGNGDRKLRTR